MSHTPALDALRDVDVFFFDVFGTVLDWRSGVARELADRFGGDVDWTQFATAWREGYMALLQRLAADGAAPEDTDVLHRQVLDALLAGPRWAHAAPRLPPAARAAAAGAWHRVPAWPDAARGLHALRAHGALLGPLANGTLRLFAHTARAARLPWDFVLPAALLGAYKPDPRVYRAALAALGVAPGAAAMVAAHAYDVRAAAACGLRTVYVRRATEDTAPADGSGERCVRDAVRAKAQGGEVDVVVDSLEELAELVGQARASFDA